MFAAPQACQGIPTVLSAPSRGLLGTASEVLAFQLLSEDMQHTRALEGLQIVNPFREAKRKRSAIFQALSS